MTTLTLEQAFEACQTNKTAWLNRKAELAAALAPELIGIKNQPAMIKNRALDRSMAYLREALSIWLTAGNDINYSAQDSDILTTIGYRPDAPSRDDNREKFTPAQSMIYTRRRAGLAAQ
ncbi:hypothetical protein LJU39_19445 [Citrobacter freundii]|uniref:Phage polarity suppression protein n=1 Tax=Citrobacter portucalensis TaxID=1639133 RepID=A0A5B0T3G2_9ENTR|nr:MULTISPECIES: phage polarity suppression protein [Citrobacter]MBY5089124.1 hypothetical protein [Citrobacter freundii]KAA1143584.1 hypothetical protein D3H66_14140 [Citrobacter portucalensis]MBW9454032.1 hypothetical protein [Citrobacter portucalensis]MBW9456044.1 hypothetical protein [Citrobacter portucalensis]MDM2919863.1 hypothetical protein [Citrobacter sp. Cpo032]